MAIGFESEFVEDEVFVEREDKDYDYRESSSKKEKKHYKQKHQHQHNGGDGEAYREAAATKVRRSSGALIILIGFSVLVVADGLIQNAIDGLNTGQPIGIGIVSVVFSVMKYCHSQFVTSNYHSLIEVLYGLAMVALWTAGVIVMTFSTDGIFFEQTGSGFFATWIALLISGYYTLNVLGNMNQAAKENFDDDQYKRSRILAYKKGVTPTVAVALILEIGVIAAGIVNLSLESVRQARAVFAIICAAISVIILCSTLFMSVKAYGDPENFFFTMFSLLCIQFFLIAFCTFSEPFAPRIEDVSNGVRVFGINGNGFFSSIGAFIACVSILWKSHIIVVKLNYDNNTSFGINGRHIWLFLLCASSVFVVVATALECDNFNGCDENIFLGPLLGLSFFSALFCLVSFYICKRNADQGDNRIIDSQRPQEEINTTEEKIELVIAIILFLLWTATVLAFTYPADSPFNVVKTGYIFIWSAFASAAFYFDAVFPKLGLLNLTCLQWQLPNQMSAKSNYGFLVTFLGVFVQAIAVGAKCVEAEGCGEQEVAAFGIQAVIFILVVVLLVMKPKTLGYLAIALAYLFVIVCYSLLLVTTAVVGPFQNEQGNGFFAAWVVVYGSLFVIAHYEWDLDDLEED